MGLQQSDESRVFRAPASLRRMLAICVVLSAVLGGAIFAALPPPQSLGALAALALLGGLLVLAALVWLIVAECVAAFRLRIELGPESLALSLPARRGHVRQLPFAGVLSYADIDRIESRDEAFHQLGLTAIQTAYRLVLKDGRSIALGADRQLRAPLFGPAAQAIADRSGLRLRQGGMVDGRAGLLAAFGTSAPAWGVPTLPAATARQRVEQGARASRNLGIFVMVMTILRLITRR